jgi:glycosyltransferase involved in cell wall biosynthesis
MPDPRVLFVGHTRYDLPLGKGLERKWDALSQRLELRVVASAGSVAASDPRFALFDFTGPRALEGVAFHAALPMYAAREVRRFRPEVVIAQSPYEAFAVLPALRVRSPRPKLLVEVHGDWRTAARLYGSWRRRALAGATDRLALAALRSADATRGLTRYTAGLAEAATGRPPVAVFPTYFDLHSYQAEPRTGQPDVPTVLWVGVLQPYKDPTTFAQAWRRIAAQVPAARLHVVGAGPQEPVIQTLVHEFPGRVRHDRRLEPPELSRAYDAATLLALPSRSEGMGRVIIEAFTRGRPVVASDVGGIPDLIRPGRNGLLAAPGDPEQFAERVVEVLSDRALAERLAMGAAADAAEHTWTADRYADAVAAMVRATLA